MNPPCRSRPRTHGLAAGLLDLLDCRLRKLVRMDGDGCLQLARTQYLDQRLLARDQPQLRIVFQRDFLDGKPGHPVEVHDRVLGAEDIVEAALRQAAVQWHLAAFKTTHQAEARTRTLALA